MISGPETDRELSPDRDAAKSAAQPVPRFLIWLHRITVLLFVLLCASAGVLLMIVPWRPEWTDNALISGSPTLQAFFGNGFVRGVCSGLGILDIWIGFWEAVHYHEPKQP
jgi:hypothetical protein